MLRVDGISKTFQAGGLDEVRSLCGVDLQVDDGAWVIVIGTNGSGKSTLLSSIAGTFPVDSGQIHIAGNNVTRWPEHARAKLIGRVFQNPFAGTAPSMSVAENLAMAVRRGLYRGLGWAVTKQLKSELRERVRTLHMGLEDRLDNPIGSLSGGQRQALTLLMSTWRKPDLLLLDEHTAALDPKSAEKVIRLTEQIVASQKITTLMVTHSMPQAAALGDRLIMMHKGSVIHDISGSEKHRLNVDDLLMRFEQVRRSDQLDESAAELLRRNYV
jgi:putative tryptophan/tyrosine transport system ATP-binding protein